MPSVSIIIPSFNSAEFLPATLASALAQPDAEIIVVDDGSTDSTPQVCAPFTDRLHYVRQANAGVSAARNHGARLAQGEWLLFLDSDDQLLPNAAGALLSEARESRAGVVYGMVIERAEPPREPRLNGFNYAEGEPPLPAQRNYARSVIITPGSAIVKKALHEKIGGFVPTFEPMEDRDYWIKCGFFDAFRFADTLILDKTWRPASAGRHDARRIWNGLRSRLQLPQWCERQQLALAGLPTDRKLMVESALKEATWFGASSILPPLLDEARKCGLSFRWTLSARFKLLAHRREPLPAWFKPLE